MKAKALVIDMDGTLYSQELVNRVTTVTIARAKEYLSKESKIMSIPKGVLEQTIDSIERTGQTSRYIKTQGLPFGAVGA